MIANHILVSFHVAFISSVLALPSVEIIKGEVLKFIFFSPETLISALFMFTSFHSGIALHEMGHFLTASRLMALNEQAQKASEKSLRGPLIRRILGLVRIFLKAPYGRAVGIKKEGLNYYPDSPYNFAVAAAGPRMSRNVAMITLLPALVTLTLGLVFDSTIAIYIGRLFLGVGIVSFLDFKFADPGKYKEFCRRERLAQEKAASLDKSAAWWGRMQAAREHLLTERIQRITHPRLGVISTPWQFRNCGMGGRHTEKEYPESNISMQEAMFLILGARDYQEAQEMTVRLQNRLKEIIEKAEGCRVMGIGLEGGLAPYIERGAFAVPELRLWAMMKQTIEECGYRPGTDVAIALDPAMSELEIAYRREFKVADSVGMYLFWRDKAQTVMDRDGVLDVYLKAIREYDIPILSIEDGFSENDFQGWEKLMSTLGDRLLVIGDDLVTTNDATIEMAASKGLVNTVLIKANQIGTLYETLLAMLVALGKGMELVVSHRSKSPNDDMEAHIALAVNALGLKAGGGANTERLMKYHAVTEVMQSDLDGGGLSAPDVDSASVVRRIYAYEEPTNAGIPTVGASVEFSLPKAGVSLKFKGATPLGTSAGTGEAIHLVDHVFEKAEHHEVFDRHPELFKESEPGVFAFKADVRKSQIDQLENEELTDLFNRTQRYNGMGCLNAVENVNAVIAPAFTGRVAAGLTIKDVDRTLLSLECRVAERRGKVDGASTPEELIRVMQRKQNLGMNAVLSVSLAITRGLAHLKGQTLFELLREEMLTIIEKLARENGVELSGSRFSDYVDALVKVNRICEKQGKEFHVVLRALTEIYPRREGIKASVSTAPLPCSVKEAPAAAGPEHPAPSAAAGDLDPEEEALLADVNQSFFQAFRDDSKKTSRHQALLEYIRVKNKIAHRIKRFGIVNNRIFVSPDEMFIPYLVLDTLLVQRIRDNVTETVFKTFWLKGKILTDSYLKHAAGVGGTLIDLENELCGLEEGYALPTRILRIRDLIEQLRTINESANRVESVCVLRTLIAWLSLFSFKKQLNAKNLQSEMYSLSQEMVRFINSPLSDRVPFLVRVFIRDIAAVVTRPKLIDRLWNDTIDLAEIHIRGSAIINELRRSTHHSIGRATLTLAKAYRTYLETGDGSELERMRIGKIAPADERARREENPKQVVGRVVEDLQRLLGNSETVGRIREWMDVFDDTLVRCEFGSSLTEERQAVLEGIRGGNKWVIYHHLRFIKSRVLEFALFLPEARPVADRLDVLLKLEPDSSSFDSDRAQEEICDCVDAFIKYVRNTCQTELFSDLEGILKAYGDDAFEDTFDRISLLRRKLRKSLEKPTFPEKRLLLFQLDGLLEEMGYLTIRRTAGEFEQKGIDFSLCRRMIYACVENLTSDGLHSRQLHDLALMLMDPSKTIAELKNVVTQIARSYHNLVQRVISPFEKMRPQIGMNEEELREALANIQRCMHDLNSIAAFTDIASSYLEGKHDKKSEEEMTSGPLWEDSDVIHLSHADAIKGLVEGEQNARNLREMYGSKGSGLVYISYLDIPTRDGFILPASMARDDLFRADEGELKRLLWLHLKSLEADIARRDGREKIFGETHRPLLLAVRGGSVFSMPGLLTTVLFVGMNDTVAEAIAEEDPWCAYDTYRRFLTDFSQAVWNLDIESYNIVEETKSRYKVNYKYDLPWEGMKEIVEAVKSIIREKGYADRLEEALNDPFKQLASAVHAVWSSWDHEAVVKYRDIKGIVDSWQTAVIVQEMALGNRKNNEIGAGMDESLSSLTGVIPRTQVMSSGVRAHTGDFKFSAAGEDLVGGLTKSISFLPMEELESFMPMLGRRLRHNVAKLRRFMGTDQEIEFTVERGILSILQSRAAEVGKNKRERGFKNPGEEDACGIGIRGSAFRGLVAFDKSDLEELSQGNLRERSDVDGVMLVMESPVPEAIPLILSADALLTAKGGSTSHAAIAINGIKNGDFSAVMSASGLEVNADQHVAFLTKKNSRVRLKIRKGDILSIHGVTGGIFVGSRETE
ncbi:MAG: hypothetical protein L6425_06850 [Candidatus Aminicenantes bacterium]|nr:hypothetical protein [Candidatus Aminicenantes bacterium]